MFWPGHHADVSKSAAGEVKENAFWRNCQADHQVFLIVAFLIVVDGGSVYTVLQDGKII